MISRRTFLQHSATLGLGMSLLGEAWASPASDLRLVYGYPAGASGSRLANQTLALLAAQGARYRLQNLDGRNTRLATETVRNATADGSVLLQAISATLTLLPSIYRHPGFDPLNDFTPVASMGDFPYALIVGPLVPTSVKTLRHYLDWVSDNAEYRNVGIAIYGSLGHLATRILARDTEVALRAQPYKGATAMLNDVRNQSLAACFTVPGNGFGSGDYQQLRCIGVTSRERMSYWPEVPTLAEMGSPSMDLTGWFGWFAPARTPDSVLQPLRQKVQAMQATPEYAAVQRDLLLTQVPLTPTQIHARMAEEVSRYQALVDTYNISHLE